MTRQSRSPVTRGRVADIYPLTPLQRGLLFHTLYSPESGVYVERLGYSIEGKLDAVAFQRAWQIVVDRHAVLRTAFALEGEKGPLQLVRSRVDLPWINEDWREVPAAEHQSRLADFVADERQRPLRLDRAPLMRMALIRLSEDAYRFFWTFHHVLLDGWSVAVVLHEVQVFYDALRRGVEPQVPPPRPFRDFVAWLMARNPTAAETFWRERLKGFEAPTPLGVNRRRATVGTREAFGSERVQISAARTAALQAFARRHNLTLNTVVQGAWAILLSRYGGTDDVVYGTTSSGRPADLSGSESMVGLFITMLPVRARVLAGAPVLSLLTSIQRQQVEQREYEYASLVDIQRWSNVPSATPLFESAFVFENYPVRPFSDGNAGGLAVREDVAESRTNYPLIVVVGPGERLSLRIDYDGSRFDSATVARMLAHLEVLLDGLLSDANPRIDDIPMLTTAERQQLLVDWNDTQVSLTGPRCVHQMFEEQAARTPDSVALVFEDRAVTYSVLNRWANRLAVRLAELGVKPNVLVGLFMERGPEMLAAILGVLKAGGAYVPLPRDYPKQRLQYMLEDCGAELVLTQEHLREEIAAGSATVECVDHGGRDDADYTVNRRTDVTPRHLAYVMYTSGSTGRPKGTMIEHASVANYLDWCTRTYPLAEGSGAPVQSSLGFDATITSLISPLIAGRRVVLLPEAREVEALGEALASDSDFGLVKLTPAHLKMLAATIPPEQAAGGTRAFVIGGEALTATDIDFWRTHAPRTRLINEYGPTETVVGCCVYEVSEDTPTSGAVAIGRPIINTQLYVLDRRMQPTPVGIAGELYIGGAGLGRGYLKRPELTAEKFVPHPFSELPGERLYKTGDLSFHGSDGELEFLGRIDDQVKLRGFRIELGEIEEVLRQQPGIADAVVVVYTAAPGDDRLVAYVVAAEGAAAASGGALREALKDRLPDYMVPTTFVTLAALPLTPNGKVDRRALPAPEPQAIESTYVAPRSPMEEILADVWASVLGVPQVGAHSDFFELGGHSLLATQVGARVRALFGVDLPLRTLFEQPTVAAFARVIEAAHQGEATPVAPPMARRDGEGDAPLSYAQERLWFLDQLEPGGSAYVVPSALRLTGPLHLAAFAAAYREVIRRHEGLRAVVGRDGEGRPVQRITPVSRISIELADLSRLAPDARHETASRLATQAAQRPFDLATGPLVRAIVVRLSDADHMVLFSAHHIVTDGWSAGLLVGEVGTLYEEFIEGRPSRLQEPTLHYADYAVWQRDWLAGGAMDAQLAYWRTRLAGAPRVLELPTDRPRPAVQSFAGGSVPVEISTETAAALGALSRREGATLFMTLLAVFQTLLYRYAGQPDVLVGTPIAGRTRAETEGMIGLFVNTLVLRAELGSDPSFRALLAQVRETALGAYAHQDVPFERLVDELKVERDLSRSPLFQVMFALQNVPAAALHMPDVSLAPVVVEQGTSKFDVAMSLFESRKGIVGALEYNPDLFDAATIQQMAGHFQALVAGVVANPDARVSALPLLNTDERARLLVEWNDTATATPSATIPEVFEAQVARTPDAVAVVAETTTLSYRELNSQANRLARRLRDLGVGPGVRVAIWLERSADLVVAILGVLKAGAAYVPVDPAYPTDRVRLMLEDSAAAAVVTGKAFASMVPEGTAVVHIGAVSSAGETESAENLSLAVGPTALAYVIYTSGSTGRPKGVCVPHGCVTNFLASMARTPGLAADDLLLAVTTHSFDISVLELLLPLTVGARVWVAAAATVSDGQQLEAAISRSGATLMQATPATWRLLFEANWPGARGLTVLCGGEPLPAALADRLNACVGALWNMYGPTETTVWSTCGPVASSAPITVGRPIANTQVYVLDRQLEPAPVGVAGELYIGGAGVTAGYWQRPDLTAGPFVPDHVSGAAGARLYRTGDLARWRPNGTLEHLGRADRQVKVRGHRIEPGEIEAVLERHVLVEACAVEPREVSGDVQLVAYVVGDLATADSVVSLRDFLRASLPDYMVPARFVTLDALPLTPNGKVDRRALPEPDQSRTELDEFEPPRTPTERALAALWSEVLGIETIGVRDDFFRLGGHSLLATRMVSRVRALFNVEYPLRAVFDEPTVAGQARYVERLLTDGDHHVEIPLSPVGRDVDLPLSHAQERLWFLDRLDSGSAAYNIPSAVRLKGPLHLAALSHAVDEILRRHAILRARFATGKDGPRQDICAATPGALAVVDLSALPDAERTTQALRLAADEANRSFDLTRGPLMRATVATLAESEHVLLLTIHHIVSDGWSMGIVIGELSRIYEAFARGETSPLADLNVQYVDVAVWQRQWLDAGALDQQLGYWRNRLSGAPQSLELLTDRSRPPVQSFRGASRPVTLSKELSEAVRALSATQGATPFMTLLAGFFGLLFRYTGQDDILVGTPIAGRSRTETENLVGLFVNTLVMRADLAGDPNVREIVTQVRDTALDAYAHQHLPLEKLLDELDVPRDLSRTPLFQVMFALQNAPVGGVEVAGLSLSPVEVEQKTAKFDLTLNLAESPGGFYGVLEYNTDLFDASTIERMAGHFVAVLEGMVTDAGQRISEIPLLSADERARQLREWNDATVEYAADMCLHEWFERQVVRTPDRVAVILDGHQITYGALSTRANQLAHHLRSLGVGPEVLVGLYMERSIELVVGILGILKAGGAYVPLDPVHPPERLAFMVADARIDVLVTEDRLSAGLPETKAHVLSLDGAWEAISRERATVPAVSMSVDNVAYVIYTSGSTGTPKGTPVTHRNVARLFAATDDWFEFGAQDVWSLFHSYAFDFSVWELWGALCYGGRLLVVPYGVSRAPDEFIDLLARERVTVLNQTPSAFRQLVAAEGKRRLDGAMSALRYVVFGGEALDVRHLAPWMSRHGERPRLVNMYGITETTVHVTYRVITQADLDTPHVDSPAGRPIPDLQVYVRDEHGELLPAGLPGEIYVAGAGVARGYHGRPELTAQRFVPSPYGEGARLYRTGDGARYLADGQLGFLGRLDQQVKIRGFRIELGEIEAVLIRHPYIEAAVVVAREDSPGDQRLVAYIVGKGGSPDVTTLRRHLKASLPDYMVPATFVVLDALPLTPNGKLDRRALPAPDGVRLSLGHEYVPPRTVEEEALAGIWSDALHVERVGIYDNFFELGGDSIRSIGIVARAKQVGLIFSLQELFQHQTIDALSRVMMDRTSPVPRSAPVREAFALITAADRVQLPADAVDAYPLARIQSGMLFHSQLNPESGVYHDVFGYRIRSLFDEQRFRAAVDVVVRRHPILRTSFHWSEFSEPLQVVHRSVPLPLEVYDLGNRPDAEQAKTFDEWFEAEKTRHFDMAQAPLLRWRVHLRSDATWHFTLSFHHAILDGWSVALLNVELFREYLSSEGLAERPQRESPAASYADFVALERSTLRSEDARRFWIDRLEDLEVTKLPRWPDAREATTDRQLRVHRVRPSAEVLAGLRQLARTAGVPLKSVLLAAHFKVQSAFAANHDVVTGLTTNGRPEELEGEQVVGVFLNSVPMRMALKGGTWTDLVHATFQTERELLPFRRYPLPEIQQALGGQPLFEVLFNFTHFHVYQNLADLGDAEVLETKFFERTNFTLVANFALALNASELELRLEYDGSELQEAQVARIGAYYASTFAAMVDDPQARYEDHSPLPNEERRQLLEEWNDTAVAYPNDTCIHEWFERQVTTGPDRTALIDDGHLVTYRALSARANRLSNHLRGLGVGPEVRVGLCMERSAELVVGILGILKAGGVYVPLDPAYPKERLAFMVADAGLEVLVTEERHVPGLPDTSARVISLDASREAISREREVAPAVQVSADNAAYVIYTSGSTGKPKGVEVPHRGVLRLLFGGDYVTLGSDVVIPHLSSPTFDASTFEVWAPLLHGGQCVLYPERVPTPLSLARAIQKHGLNTMWLTSALFNAVVDEAPGLLAGVDQLLIGGEALSLNHVQRALAALPSTTIINGYGPTESTTFACCHPIPVALRTTTQSIPIGRPIGNTTVNVLDAHMQPVPLGASGELLIGGAGLARGYLDRADLTAERFVPDPYGAHAGGRVYRTGDVARYLPDGNVEFLGRVDHQVKLRGFRIELGEIEAVLRDHPALRDAVVVVREDAPGQARLVAYTVAHAQSPDVSEVRNYLKASLPDYMVPSAFVALDALPLTPNGKVDRRALPDPSPERPATPESLVAARSPQEEIISGIWAEVLGIERVGVHDDFFEFGGHSLLATQVMSRVRNAFQVELPLRVLFEAPTIAGLSEKLTAAIRANRELDSPPIVPRSREGELPLSFAQQRLWLLDRMRPGDSSYNVSAAIRLRGRLDAAALDQTFSEICRRQDVLRANFVDVDGRPVQVNRPARPLVLPLVDLSNLEGPAREAQATDLVERETARSFDLARDSLIRLHLLRMGDEDHVLLFSTHHIICDGWSVGVIVGELSSLYVRFTGGGPSPLEELKVQYSDFAGWQRDWLQGKALEAQLSYWRTQLGADPPRLALPTDRPRPQVETLQGQTYTVVLPASLTTRLKALSRAEGVTTFMTLLAAFKAQLQRYTGQDDIVVGTDMANRNRQEIEGLIGFFINLLVLRTDLGGNPSFRQLLKRVREKALEAYAHQDLPFDRLVEELQPERHLSDTPLFQVLFVLQNTPTSDLRLGGLLVQPVPLPSTTSKFDLAVFVSEGDAGISVTWQFKTDLFEGSTITRIAQHFERVLESVVDDPQQPIGRLRLVEEKKKPERIRRTRPQAAALPDVGILTSDES